MKITLIFALVLATLTGCAARQAKAPLGNVATVSAAQKPELASASLVDLNVSRIEVRDLRKIESGGAVLETYVFQEPVMVESGTCGTTPCIRWTNVYGVRHVRLLKEYEYTVVAEAGDAQ